MFVTDTVMRIEELLGEAGVRGREVSIRGARKSGDGKGGDGKDVNHRVVVVLGFLKNTSRGVYILHAL
jgi:hypothetical protein